jgi:hypothetical protein
MANIRDPYDGTYFTGVGAMLEITPRDAAGNPITGIAVKEEVTTESGELVRQRKEAIPVGPDGTFTDLVGIGKIPPPTSPLPRQEVFDLWRRIVEAPRNQVTVQTLTFYGPGGYLLGTASYRRQFTNVDENGKLNPYVNPVTGRGMVNFTIKLGPVKVN